MSDNKSDIPIVKSLILPQCRHMICGGFPFAMLFSMPFILIFSYYNTQNQKPFMKWNAKSFGKDILLGWTIAISYVSLRTLFFDPYCDPKSIHYDKNLNAFERKKKAFDEVQNILRSEGKRE
ncbi:unnamed protein product [Blepharisma stoltei]|uniref:Uncharacterized protein n=1 Tax=Blepharisma stoltei TaxID=1481888 RepID=A0AAU9ILX7_9CILI|nr:unnamed protein product [Blepharisma stoltei]